MGNAGGAWMSELDRLGQWNAAVVQNRATMLTSVLLVIVAFIYRADPGRLVGNQCFSAIDNSSFLRIISSCHFPLCGIRGTSAGLP